MDDTSLHIPDDTLSYIAPIGFSYYANGYSLTPEFYQTLVDRCWRRSGSLLYRPNQKSACCPHYTLRLDSAEFKPSKDQRAAVNRFNRTLLGDEYIKKAAQKFPLTREQARKRDATFDLADRIHEAEADKLHEGLKSAHELKVTLEPDTFTDEKFAIYKNYQSVVHGEELSSISERGFRRFLCDSPVRHMTTPNEISPGDGERKLGSFHQCYRLDGVLVAIGVLDLLPHAVSAVYFMYHESIQKHQPGKLGALREIALAQECGYRYWYPGYYIHSCPKMRYKIDYSPQYVLDPETLQWDLLDKEALDKLDRQPYVSLSRERDKAAAVAAVGGSIDGSEETGGAAQSSDAVGAKDDAQAGDLPTVESDQGEGGYHDADEADEDDDEEEEEEEEEDDLCLFTSSMPGIPTIAELDAADLDQIRVLSDQDSGFFLTGNTLMWSDSIWNFGSLKSKIAELVACLGTDTVPQIVLDFRRASRARAG